MTAMPAVNELELEECRSLLSAGRFGRLAVVVGGQPLIFPVNYRSRTAQSSFARIAGRNWPGRTFPEWRSRSTVSNLTGSAVGA